MCILKTLTLIFLILNSIFFTKLYCQSESESNQRDETFRTFIAKTEFRGGLIVHMGNEIERIMSLSQKGKFYVHGLVSTKKAEELSRNKIQELNLDGLISIEMFNNDKFIYADNLVNIMIIEDIAKEFSNGLTLKEILRALCPRGVAYLGVKRKG